MSIHIFRKKQTPDYAVTTTGDEEENAQAFSGSGSGGSKYGFEEGDLVYAKWGTKWLPAAIVFVENGGTYEVEWVEGGTFTYGMPASDLRHRESGP